MKELLMSRAETIRATKKVVLAYNPNYKISTHESISSVQFSGSVMSDSL